MELSSSLVKSFAAVTDDTEEVTSKSTAYGTVVVSGGFNYVVLDGSNELTSISEGTAVQDGDRVIVTIENHVATVTSNLSAPSTGRITAAMVDEALVEGYFDVLTAQYASIEYLQANYITAKEIDSEYASFEYLSTNYLNADYILSTFASFEYVDMGYAEIEKAIITEAEIEDLIAAHAFITDADIEHLAATVAEIEEAYVTYEEVDTLVANYVDAVYEYVNLIDADVANIMNLLAGNAGVGDLQAIYLTADNVVIDSAVIEDALIGTVLADIITSNVIYTDYITIANNEGQNFLIDGATLQINDGTVIRVQIGLDADGNYNFYLFNEEGIAIWDALGLTEAGLIGNGAIIRDVAVADDANISGYKLNIDEITTILNENGDLILDAAQITIDGESLDYKLTEITQSAVKEVINYYAIGPSYEYPPCEPGEEIYDAICGVAICGISFIGTIGWTTERLYAEEDGEYLWYVQKIIYADGSEGWTEPTCLTDEYTRTKTSTLTTELEVIQGQISSKVWMTDIEEATNVLGEQITTISDQYGELVVTVDSISERVSSLTVIFDTEFQELYSQVSDIVVQLGEIDLEVAEVVDYVDEQYSYLYEAISEITIEGGLIDIKVSELETSVGEEFSSIKEQISEINVSLGSITLSVYDSDSGMAYIELISGDTVSGAEVVTNARKAFENDSTSIVISAGTILFESNTLLIDSDQFTLDEDGNATFGGILNAPGGTIGGFTIGSSSIYSSQNSFGTVENNIYIGSSGISLGTTFKVTMAGKLTATNGTIGGFTFNSTRLYGDWESTDGTTYRTTVAAPSDNLTYVFAAGGDASASNYSEYPFRVNKNGTTYVKTLYVYDSLRIYDSTAKTNVIAVTTDYTTSLETSESVVFGTSSRVTFIRGYYVSVNSSLDVSGTVTVYGSNIYLGGSSSASHFWSNSTVRKNGCSVWFGTSSAGNTGIYDTAADDDELTNKGGWIIRSATDYVIYVGNSNTPENRIQGDVIYVGGSSTSTTYIQGSNVHVQSAYNNTTSSSANVHVGSAGLLARYQSSSSIRYKDVIRELTPDDVSKLYNIVPIWFTYKEQYLSSKDERYMTPIPGFIAEDWNEIIPIAVDHGDEGLPESWNSNIVVPLMFEMIKCDHSEIEDIEDRMDILQLEVDRLTAENEALKQELAEITAA